MFPVTRLSRAIAAQPKTLSRREFIRHNCLSRQMGDLMNKTWLCLCLLAATAAVGQQKKSTGASGGISPAARMCDDPYAVKETADGWPEGPINILFHREKSKLPWSHNAAIRVAGLEAAASSSARTLVCVEESQLEMGHYDSGELGYVP